MLICPFNFYNVFVASIRRTESTRSDRAGKAAFDESQPQHYGIRLRLGDSSWSQPLALDVLSTTGNGDSGLGDGNRSVLIRAEASGVLYEVIARLDVTPYNDAQVYSYRSLQLGKKKLNILFTKEKYHFGTSCRC